MADDVDEVADVVLEAAACLEEHLGCEAEVLARLARLLVCLPEVGVAALEVFGNVQVACCLSRLLVWAGAQADATAIDGHDSLPPVLCADKVDIRGGELVPPTIVVHEVARLLIADD